MKTFFKRIEEYEIFLIVVEVEKANGNVAEAARQLGMNRPTLVGKLKKYGLRHPKTKVQEGRPRPPKSGAV